MKILSEERKMALKEEDHRSQKPSENMIVDPTHMQMGRKMSESQ